jgi:hypothetical protein
VVWQPEICLIAPAGHLAVVDAEVADMADCMTLRILRHGNAEMRSDPEISEAALQRRQFPNGKSA